MTDMIERVARALWEKRRYANEAAPWDALPHLAAELPDLRCVQDEYRELARIAIAAMRDPTEEMVSLMAAAEGCGVEGDAVSMPKSGVWKLPSWEEAESLCKRGEGSVLDKFICDNEPAGPDDSKWRSQLAALVHYLTGFEVQP